MAQPSTARLVAATTAHFAWAIAGDGEARSVDGLRLPPGGLDAPKILAWIQRSADATTAALGAPSAWLVVEGDEAVGLISFKAPPEDGSIEIGYGVAESRRRRGHARRAVALVLDEARRLGLAVHAETEPGNLPSEAVLVQNGFVREREIDRDGERTTRWRR